MGKTTGFLEIERRDRPYAPVGERVTHWHEFIADPGPEAVSKQAARCMDCGIPFCHSGKLISGMASGCPINNLIPEWNDLIYRGLVNRPAEEPNAKFALRLESAVEKLEAMMEKGDPER